VEDFVASLRQKQLRPEGNVVEAKVSRLVLRVLTAALAVTVSSQAVANHVGADATINGFTIDMSMDYTIGGLDIRLDPVLSVDPHYDIVELAGGTLCAIEDSGCVQDWFIVDVTVLSTSVLDLWELGIGNIPVVSEGSGYIFDTLCPTCIAPTSVDAMGDAPGTPETPLFSFSAENFGPTNGSWGGGPLTSFALVVGYAAGSLPGAGASVDPDGPGGNPPIILVPPGTVSFMVDGFTVQGTKTMTIVGGVAIPEPGTVQLVGLGMIVLGLHAHRRKRLA
jgi:hypothetical protein